MEAHQVTCTWAGVIQRNLDVRNPHITAPTGQQGLEQVVAVVHSPATQI